MEKKQVATQPLPKPVLQPEEMTSAILDAAWSRNGFSTRVMDVSRLVTYTDIFVILSGRSSRHVRAIADEVETRLKERGVRPLGVEGLQASTWVLMDYGSVVVHIFEPQTRAFYDLERLWSDATPIPVEEPPWVKDFERMEEDYQGF